MAGEDNSHVLTHFDDKVPAEVSLRANGAPRIHYDTIGHADLLGSEMHVNKMLFNELGSLPVGNGPPLAPPLPGNPSPFHGRAPLMYEPNSYLTINPGQHLIQTRNETIPRQQPQNPITQDPSTLNNEEFDKFARQYRTSEGKYMAMTCYGAVPVPQDVLDQVPDHFEREPMYKEQEHFVMKEKKHERRIQKQYVQHDHHFVEVVRSGVIDKIVPVGEKRKIEIPNYTYKGVIADNVIEVPQGTKYAEVPLDVYMKKPPKLVPVAKPIVIQRLIECNKHVVQDKVIEVPKVVKRSVPKHVVKELPFVTPKYVEKVIEVPFKPGMRLPSKHGERLLEMPPVPTGNMVVGIATHMFDNDGEPLVLSVDGRSLYTTTGQAFRDAQGHPLYLAPDANGFVDATGKFFINNEPRDGLPTTGPFAHPGTPIYVLTPKPMSEQDPPRDPSEYGAFGIPDLPYAAVAHLGPPDEQIIQAPFLCDGTQAFIDGNSITFTGQGEQCAIVPQDVRDIHLPYEAEIDISVVACDPDSGIPLELLPEEERVKFETPPPVKAPYWQLPRVPKEIQEQMINGDPALASNLLSQHATPGFAVSQTGGDHARGVSSAGHPVEATNNSVYFPPQRLGDNKSFVTETKMTFNNTIPKPSDAVSRISGNTYAVNDSDALISRGFYTATGVPDEAEPDSPGGWDSSIPKPDQLQYNYDPNVGYASRMEAIWDVCEPGMRGVNYKMEPGPAQVVTRSGVKNLDTLHWTCGDPANQLQAPFRQDKVPVPVDQESGGIDVIALEEVQKEYLKRINTSFNMHQSQQSQDVKQSESLAPEPRESLLMPSSSGLGQPSMSSISRSSHVTESKAARDATSSKKMIKVRRAKPTKNAEEKVAEAKELREVLDRQDSNAQKPKRKTQ